MATRREFLGSDVLTAAPEAWPIPQEVAGVKLPDSKLARDATDFTRGLSAPVVFNHVLRTYLLGELIGRAKGLKFDSELFYLGAVFHDLGQTERFMGQQRFGVDGADAAAEFLKDKGVPQESVEVVWDAVALHSPSCAASPSASGRKSPWSARGPRQTLPASGLPNSPRRRSPR
jgi:HD domain